MVAFSRNGQLQGVAYADIPDGTYYAAASLYTLPDQAQGASVTFNFGPNFQYAPPQVCVLSDGFEVLYSVVRMQRGVVVQAVALAKMRLP